MPALRTHFLRLTDTLRTDCIFLRLNAPRIEIGQLRDEDATPSLVPVSANSAPSQRFFHEGDLTFNPAKSSAATSSFVAISELVRVRKFTAA